MGLGVSVQGSIGKGANVIVIPFFFSRKFSLVNLEHRKGLWDPVTEAMAQAKGKRWQTSPKVTQVRMSTEGP